MVRTRMRKDELHLSPNADYKQPLRSGKAKNCGFLAPMPSRYNAPPGRHSAADVPRTMGSWVAAIADPARNEQQGHESAARARRLAAMHLGASDRVMSHRNGTRQSDNSDPDGYARTSV